MTRTQIIFKTINTLTIRQSHEIYNKISDKYF